jgi:chaperone modulatory protein CbpM
VQPIADQSAWHFGGNELARMRRICRPQRDREANLHRAAVVLDLIDEIEHLRMQLQCVGIAAS